MTKQQTVNELELFDKTIEAVRNLKLYNHTASEWAGRDFFMKVDRGLLNPAFYIYEIYGGEALIGPIVFDRAAQSFYVRETGKELTTHNELIQHVNRGLIQWASSPTTIKHFEEDKESIAQLEKDFAKIKEYNIPEYTRLHNEFIELKKALLIEKLDFSIVAYYGDIEALETYKVEYMEEVKEIDQKLRDTAEEIITLIKNTDNNGIMRRLMRLLTK